MFSRRDKIIKKDGQKPTDIEEDVAKALSSLESNNKALKSYLSIIFINSVENVQYEKSDGSTAEYILVKIPYRSLSGYKKVGGLVVEKLESQFEKPVIIVANRTIISPNGKSAIHCVSLRTLPSTRHLPEADTAENLRFLLTLRVPGSDFGEADGLFRAYWSWQKAWLRVGV